MKMCTCAERLTLKASVLETEVTINETRGGGRLRQQQVPRLRSRLHKVAHWRHSPYITAVSSCEDIQELAKFLLFDKVCPALHDLGAVRYDSISPCVPPATRGRSGVVFVGQLPFLLDTKVPLENIVNFLVECTGSPPLVRRVMREVKLSKRDGTYYTTGQALMLVDDIDAFWSCHKCLPRALMEPWVMWISQSVRQDAILVQAADLMAAAAKCTTNQLRTFHLRLPRNPVSFEHPKCDLTWAMNLLVNTPTGCCTFEFPPHTH